MAKSHTTPRPTLQTVADHAGVSHQTVANVLNASEKVSETTRLKVLKSIRQLNYRPNENARALAGRATRMISYHVGAGGANEASILDPFMRLLAQEAEGHGYRIVLDSAGESDQEQIRSYEELDRRSAIDAVVVTKTHVKDTRPQWLVEHGIPMVAFGRPWNDLSSSHSWVDIDGKEAMTELVNHLAFSGHHRITYVGPAADGALETNRIDGFLAGLATNQISVGKETHLLAEAPTELRRILPSFVKEFCPTAICCRDDVFAFEVAQILLEIGLVPGQDIAITGFDDSLLSRINRPPLTTVRQPLEEVVKLIWESLLMQLEGKDSGQPPLQRLITPTVVVRESSEGVRI